MNVTHLRAENYRSWKSLDLDLPQGVTAITGPNGAGKTSLLSVIDTALFGGSGSLRDLLADGETTLLAEVTFEHGGETYRVRRSYTAKSGGKSTLDLDHHHDLGDDPRHQTWDALTCETQKATQERINTLIGLTPATWESSAYLRQGGGSWADPSIPPRQRKEMLSQALGLDQWDRMLVLARADRVIVSSERDFVGGQIETLAAAAAREDEAHEALTTARLDRDAARQNVDELRAVIDRTAEHLRAAEAAAVERQRVERELAQARLEERAATANVKLVDERIASITQATATRPALEREASDLVHREQTYNDLVADAARRGAEINAWTAQRDQLIRDRDRHYADGTRAAATIERLEADRVRHVGQILHTRDAPDATCHTCGQALHDEARRQALAGLEKALDDLSSAIRDAESTERVADDGLQEAAQLLEALPAEPEQVKQGAIDAARAAAQKAREAASELAAITAREERLPEMQAAREQAAVAAAKADARAAIAEAYLAEPAPNVDGLREMQALRENELQAAIRQVSEAEQAIGHADARLAQAIAARHQVDALKAAATSLDGDLAALDACIAAYGPGGIPALILETSAIPQLEGEANRVLAELGTEFRVELATQRAKRSGDGLIETLDVIVHSSQGARSYELFSGGERTRINLALRLALAQLLAHRRGADVRLFLVDEPEGLDASGLERLAVVLRRLESTFDRIVVISHHQDLRDAFDQVLEVERGSDGSSSFADQVAVEVAT